MFKLPSQYILPLTFEKDDIVIHHKENTILLTKHPPRFIIYFPVLRAMAGVCGTFFLVAS